MRSSAVAMLDVACAQVDRVHVRACLEREMARLDAEFAAIQRHPSEGPDDVSPAAEASIRTEREIARSILRSADANRLTDEDWRSIAAALSPPEPS